MRVSGAQYQALRHRRPIPRAERDVVEAVLQYLALRKDTVAWRNNVGAMTVPETLTTKKRTIRFGFAGLPDIIGWCSECLNCLLLNLHGDCRQRRIARPLFIECKSTTGRLRDRQSAFLELAQKAGCRAFVARSVEDVRKELGG